MDIDAKYLKRKLGENKTEEVINELVEISKLNQEKYNQSILIQSKYKELKKNIIIGIENSNSELQKIKYGILKLIDEIVNEHNTEDVNIKAIHSKLDRIKIEFNTNDIETVSLIFQIGESTYEWRKGKTLELKMGLSEDEIAKIARRNPEIFERGQNNNEEILYKLKDKYHSIYKGKII